MRSLRLVGQSGAGRRLALAWLAAVAFAVMSLAAAHASLDATDPADGAVLEAGPREVTLDYSENVEVGFSVFAVHRLDADIDLGQEHAQQRISGLAAPQVKDWLAAPTSGDTLVPMTYEPNTGKASQVVLTFDEELAPGHYVVVWRVLSADTHPVEGFFTFSVTQ